MASNEEHSWNLSWTDHEWREWIGSASVTQLAALNRWGLSVLELSDAQLRAETRARADLVTEGPTPREPNGRWKATPVVYDADAPAGPALRQAREAAGISARQLVRAGDLSRRMLAAIERGQREDGRAVSASATSRAWRTLRRLLAQRRRKAERCEAALAQLAQRWPSGAAPGALVLASVRALRGWTAAELARRSGLSPKAVAQLESGLRWQRTEASAVWAALLSGAVVRPATVAARPASRQLGPGFADSSLGPLAPGGEG